MNQNFKRIFSVLLVYQAKHLKKGEKKQYIDDTKVPMDNGNDLHV